MAADPSTAPRANHHTGMAARHVRGPRPAVAQAVGIRIAVGGVRGVRAEHLGRVEEAIVVGIRVERVGGDRPPAGLLVPVVAAVVVGVPITGIGPDGDFLAIEEAVPVRVGIAHIPDGIIVLLATGRSDDRAHGSRCCIGRAGDIGEVLVVGPAVGDSDRDERAYDDRAILDSVVIGIVVVHEWALHIAGAAKGPGQRTKTATRKLLGVEQVIVVGVDVQRIAFLIERPLRPRPSDGDQLIGIHQRVVVGVLVERVGPGDVHLFVV